MGATVGVAGSAVEEEQAALQVVAGRNVARGVGALRDDQVEPVGAGGVRGGAGVMRGGG